MQVGHNHTKGSHLPEGSLSRQKHIEMSRVIMLHVYPMYIIVVMRIITYTVISQFNVLILHFRIYISEGFYNNFQSNNDIIFYTFHLRIFLSRLD